MIIRRNRVVNDDPNVEVVDEAATPALAGYSIADRLSSIIYLLASIVGAIIVLRFVLLLIGANQNNEFASWVMKISQPLVQPFLTLFGYSPSVGQGVIEWTDLVALAVYWIAAAILARLLHLMFAPRYSSVVYR